jgi:glycine dehydrogenase subunit 1
MLSIVGLSSLEELFRDIPEEARLKRDLKLPLPMSEAELRKKFKTLANKNHQLDDQISFLGAGVYRHHIPAIVPALISRGEFATAYTPYQAEASQGTLQAIYEYQSLICKLMGMEAANASHYDGSTALAEACFMAAEISQKSEILISRAIHPHYRQVIQTYLKGSGISLLEIPLEEGATSKDEVKKMISAKTAGVVLQSPNFLGCIEDTASFSELCKQHSFPLVAAVNEPLAYGILKSPGEVGADIVAGEGQSLGIPPSFGGPHVGFIAVKQQYIRKLPGRLVGMTLDSKGVPAFTLTLQAREQHIRREKASSNICTNQSLCAVANAVYLSVLGKQGVQEAARQCYHKAHYAFQEWKKETGLTLLFKTHFFHEFVLQSPIKSEKFLYDMEKQGILAGYSLEKNYPEFPGGILLTVTEVNTKEEILNFSKKAQKILESQKCLNR